MWHDQIKVLETTYHCLAIDLPGNGESYQATWTSFADTADRIADIIRTHASGGTAHVIGLSLGGYAAVHLLAQHPEVVETMIVSGVTMRPFPRPWLIRPIVRLLPHLLQRNWVINLSAKAVQLPDEIVPLYQQDSKRAAADMIRRVYDEVLSISPPPNLAQANKPLLVVAGEREAKLVLDSLLDLPALLPTAVAAQAPNVHHAWAGEDPELFTEMIRQWISSNTLPAALARIPL